mgnify:CR=1 FL=1
MRGLIPFKLYPFQKKIVQEIEAYRFNILRKFRQAGCTTISASYSLWLAIFKKHQSIVILSMGDTEATEVLERIRVMYNELPPFLRPEVVESNKHTMKLANGSTIKSRPSGKQSGRSLAGSFLIIDEAAFIDNIGTIWAAVYPIISTGGRALVLSTVNGLGNWYYETYTKAFQKGNAFNSIDIHWKEHPEYFRNPDYQFLYDAMEKREPPIFIDDWERITKANMSQKKWLQEFECQFLGTGDTFIDGPVLTYLAENINKEYHTKYNNRMRVWKEPEPHYEYIIGVDTALGRELDYSAAQIINTYNGEVVAEFYSNKTPINDFASILYSEGLYYNLANIIIERNTIGNHLVDVLYNSLEYENMWHDAKGNAGFQTTASNRDQILAELEESIRTNILKINSERTLNELNTFVITESGRINADRGKHDDLIMSLALANTVLRELRDTTIMEFKRETAFKSDELSKDKFNMPIITGGGRKIEDLTWLTK